MKLVRSAVTGLLVLAVASVVIACDPTTFLSAGFGSDAPGGVARAVRLEVGVQQPIGGGVVNVVPGTGYEIRAGAGPQAGAMTAAASGDISTTYLIRGDPVTLIAQPNPGYRFDRWTGELSGSGSSRTFAPGSDATVFASFRRNEWVTLVYMMADNDLEQYAIADVNEMEAGDVASAASDVAVLLDRGPGGDTSNGDWTDTRLYRITPDRAGINSEIVSQRLASASLGISADGSTPAELNLGSPTTIEAFLEWADNEYPSENKMLIFWGHEQGWNEVGSDDSSGGDTLSLSEIKIALRDHSVRVVGFDASYCATIERAYELRDAADYMVASQGPVPYSGWDYRGFIDAFAAASANSRDLDSETVARIAADAYADGQSDGAFPQTVSVLDLAAASAAEDALNRTCDVLYTAVDSASLRDSLRDSLFADVQSFYAVPGQMYLDMGDLSVRLSSNVASSTSSDAVLGSALSKLVVEEHHDDAVYPNATGVSLYFVPLSDTGAPATHEPTYFRNGGDSSTADFVRDSAWVPVYPSGPGLLYRLWYETMP